MATPASAQPLTVRIDGYPPISCGLPTSVHIVPTATMRELTDLFVKAVQAQCKETCPVGIFYPQANNVQRGVISSASTRTVTLQMNGPIEDSESESQAFLALPVSSFARSSQPVTWVLYYGLQPRTPETTAV